MNKTNQRKVGIHCRHLLSKNSYMPIILLLYLLISCSIIKSTSNNDLNCLALQKTVETPIFSKQFYLENYSGDFIIVDTNKYISNCNLNSINGREILMISVMNEESNIKKDFSAVYLAIGRKGNILSIGLWCPAHGGSLTTTFEVEGNELNLLGYKIGDF